MTASDGLLTDSFDFTIEVEADEGGDGVADIRDNALFVPNADQRDTDGDDHGNVIDVDLDHHDLFVDAEDYLRFLTNYFSNTPSPDADFDGDGFVNASDLFAFVQAFNSSVGDLPFVGVM